MAFKESKVVRKNCHRLGIIISGPIGIEEDLLGEDKNRFIKTEQEPLQEENIFIQRGVLDVNVTVVTITARQYRGLKIS